MQCKPVVLLLIASFDATLVLAQNPATSVSVDASANRRPINPNIYGIAYGDGHDMQALNPSLNRWGGNSTTRYNWQIDAHSAAADWYFETYSDGSGTPGGSADQYVATTRSPGSSAQPMFTIPMIDYLANLGVNRTTLAGFSVKKYGAQTATDFWNPDAGNGVSSATGKNITGNNPLDTGVANSTAVQQSWVQHFVNTFGPASTAGGIHYYLLDNEPSLWHSTHRDIHPNPSTYQEMYNKIVAYASAIRAADANAKIVGFEEWSWWAMYFSGLDQANGWGAANSDYNTHNHTYYYPWLLQQLYAYKQQTGTPLLDILTVHCYNALPDGNDDSLAGQQARNRETRILWDPTFQDPSWYGDIGINGRVLNWISTLRAMVNQYHPGLQIGCTEYNWGDEAHLNGATTQADVLGIYGREGFDLATRWTVAKNTGTTPATYYVTYLASQIYRNYDGNNGTFGDVSVSATTANPDNLSAFASTRSSDGALTVVVINKQQGSTPVTVSLANFATAGTAQAWQINSASQTSIAHLADVAVANNAIATTVPSQSITLFVVPAGSTTTPPPPTFTSSATASPNPVAQGKSTTITAIVTDTANTLTNGIVQILVADAGGNTVASQNFTGQNFSTNQAQKYTLAFTPAGSGTFRVRLGVFSATWQTWHWNDTAASITVNSSLAFSSSATATPSTTAPGTGTSIQAMVTDTGTAALANANIEVQVFNSAGTAVSTNVWSGQNFTGGQSQQYTYMWNVPASLAAGNYTVMIGVFDAAWTTNYHWNSNGATITVTAAQSSGATNVTSLVKVTSSSLVFNRTSKKYQSTVTVQSQSQQSIAGPLQLVLTKLPAGVTLSNASGTTGGSPFLTISTKALAAGRSASVKIVIEAASANQISFTPVVYSGTF